MKKNDLIVLLIFSFIFIILVFIYTNFYYKYGSMTDWIMQHTVFPDYFRSLFYSTGDLTPNLALNIGAGQNIYYFSYYGLLSPYTLLSYFFPFIKMIDYMIIINILIVIISSYLIYKWLINNNYNNKIAFISALLFMLISSFFHMHRHIMFINYMPFLILGLMGVDRYFKDKKSYLLIISVFLIIMTSYYFSIGSLLCLLLYAIYKYIEINKDINIKQFIIDGLKFIKPLFIGMLLSSVLIIPTIMAIINSREHLNTTYSLTDLFIPNINFDSLLYSNYGMGFTAISLLSLIYILLYKKGSIKFLSISIILLISIPLFIYILNGMLYIRGKVLIPLSPLIILMIAIFISDLNNKLISLNKYYKILILTIITCLISSYFNFFFYLDLIIISIVIILYIINKKQIYFYIPLIIISLVTNIIINKSDNYVAFNTYNEIFNSNISNLINKIDDKSFYRISNISSNTSLVVNKVYNLNYYHTSIYSSTYNSYYRDFFVNQTNNAIPYRNNLMLASSNNLIFQNIMGIKYIITDKDNVPEHYNFISNYNNIGIYKNDNVRPIGISSNSLMSEEEYNKLTFPYNNEALLNYIIVNKDVKSNYISKISKVNLNYINDSNIDIFKEKDITLKEDKSFIYKLNKSINNKLLFIKIKLLEAPKCSDGDIYIEINHIKNTLTCKSWLYFNNNYTFEYVISSNKPIKDLNIKMSKGTYKINNIDTYIMPSFEVLNSNNDKDSFIVKRHKNDVIEGNISVKANGYFMISIPYDKGFKVYLNNKIIPYEIVNKSFIGFPLNKGNHNIILKYKSPGYDLGITLSIIGLFVLLITFFEKRRIL